MYIELPPSPVSSPIGLFLLEPDHVTDGYVAWLNDRQINEYLESRYVTHTIASTRAFVAAALAAPDILFLGIRCRSTGSGVLGKHVGNIKLGPIDRQHGTGVVGILIGDREVWGKGVASTAIRMMAEIAHSRLALRKLTAGCYGSNVGSRRAFEKAGFLVEVVQELQGTLNGKPEDIVLLRRYLC